VTSNPGKYYVKSSPVNVMWKVVQ